MYSNRESGTFVRETADFHSGSPVFVREPIAVETIAGHLRANGILVDVIHQTTLRDDDVIDAIAAQRARILGVSVHSTNLWPRILQFIRKCKERLPGLCIVCGGNHPSRAPEIALERCVDYVVRGEGENVFFELCTAILGEKQSDIDAVKGVSYEKDGRLVNHPSAPRFDFEKSPWAMRKKEVLAELKCAPLSYPIPQDQVGVAQMSYSRGCPFTCDFCVSPLVFPGKVQFRDPRDVVDEIEHLQAEFGTNFVFFNDLTFDIHKGRTMALCREIISRKVKFHWFAYCSVYLKEDVVAAMAEAGCSRIGVGVETFSNEMNQIYKPQSNIEKANQALELSDRYGILNRVYLMIGYPEETREILAEIPSFMKNLPIDQPRLAFITPFPGTPFYERMKDSLGTHDLEKYSGDYPILVNKRIPAEEYMQIRDGIMHDFYNSNEYRNRVVDKCSRFPHLNATFSYFIGYLKTHGVLNDDAHQRFSAELAGASARLEMAR
jgi:anaerobic magnesium-protoporphyrin IX monomethyl ester cyclase